MKKLVFRSVFMLTIAASFLNCSSDSDSDDPDPVVTCPTGYTGSNCNIQLTPSKITISKIRLTSFPESSSAGIPWDIGGKPDIFVQFGKGNGDANTILLYQSTNVAENAVNMNGTYYDYIPAESIFITDISAVYALNIYDLDSSTSFEQMASMYFQFYNPTGGFPAEKTFQLNIAGEQPFIATFYLSYEW